MKSKLQNFSSISPVNMLGKRKNFYNYTKLNKNEQDYYKYELKDSKITDFVYQNIVPTNFWWVVPASIFFSGAFYSAENPLLSAGCFMIGSYMLLMDTLMIPFFNPVIVDDNTKGQNEKFHTFGCISKAICSMGLNAGYYTLTLPAKLVSKAILANEHKLLKTDEGKKIVAQKYESQELQKQQKQELKKLKAEIDMRNLATKYSKKLKISQKRNEDLTEEINSLKKQNNIENEMIR